MDNQSPELVELARYIVQQEAGGSRDPAASAAAVDRSCRRLSDQLVDLLGFGGVSALLRRSLYLAQRDQPLLAGVAASSESGECFIGLAESLAKSTDEEAAAAAASMLSHLFGILVMLLGEELGMRTVHNLWPRANSARDIDK